MNTTSPETKKTIIKAMALIAKMLSDDDLESVYSFDIPEIGNPGRLKATLDARMKPLPFTSEEVEETQSDVEHAIKFETRINKAASRGVIVLHALKDLIPKVAAMAVGA
jgi:hypothetical protein